MELTGWRYTDAVKLVDCPNCGSVAATYCKRPSGRKAWPPHVERLITLSKAEDLAAASRHMREQGMTDD